MINGLIKLLLCLSFLAFYINSIIKMQESKKQLVVYIAGKGLQVVQNFFFQRNQIYELIYDPYSTMINQFTYADIIYTNTKALSLDYADLREGQLYNHLEFQSEIYNKINFRNNLKIFDRQRLYGKLDSKKFYPQTYVFEFISKNFDGEQEYFMKNEKKGIWIVKPQQAARGQGIYLTSNLTNNKSSDYYSEPLFIQKYIEQPLLLEGKKFDIRCYFVVVSMKPLVIFFHHGYVRRSLLNYTLDDIENQVIHLVNQAIQQTHPQFKNKQTQSLWSMSQFFQYLQLYYMIDQERQDLLQLKIKKALLYCFFASFQKHSSEAKQNLYQIFGVDITIDSDYNPYVIQFNVDPMIFTDNKVLKDAIPMAINSTLKLISKQSEILKKGDKTQYEQFWQSIGLTKIQETGSLELIYNEANGIDILKQETKGKKESKKNKNEDL